MLSDNGFECIRQGDSWKYKVFLYLYKVSSILSDCGGSEVVV